jgi:Na+/H+ antiporter NhaD/arsenite permease-like protein
MKASLKVSTVLSAAVAIPVTIMVFPPAAIPIAAIAIIAAAIVLWHLKHGGRALLRRTPKGTITFVLDSAHRPSIKQEQK